MNTLFFKYAIEIERTRSITKAAENLFMAQPNLSKAIKEMEETLGFSIFERNSKGIMPTQKGNSVSGLRTADSGGDGTDP
jgi:DNA-binding transcriptional LysR family regulator